MLRLFLIPITNLYPLLMPEPIVAFRLTIDIFRVLTRDEPTTPFNPASVLDYLNLHQKKLIVLKSSPFQASYSPLSLGQLLYLFNFQELSLTPTDTQPTSLASKRRSYDLADFLKAFYFDVATAVHNLATNPRLSLTA